MKAFTPVMPRDSGLRLNLRSSADLGWDGFGADLVNVSAGVHRIPALDYHRVGIHVGPPVSSRCACAGKPVSRIEAHGDADVIPAGLDGQWADESDCSIFRVWFAQTYVDKIFEQLELKPGDAQIRPRLQMRDARFQHLAWALKAELEAEQTSERLFAESLCNAMIVRLIGTPGALAVRRGALAPRMAAHIAAFIDHSLSQGMTLAELAAAAGLSVPHFKVQFRETFGMPVHRYVVQRRVERARTLLLQGRLNASQVALEAGFAHQSHMAHWMNRLLGVTPRELVKHRA